MLCDNPRISIETVKIINPAMLLPVHPGGSDHDCIKIMGEVFSRHLDLSNELLDHPAVEYFTDGSSFVHQGERLVAYAVVSIPSSRPKSYPKEILLKRLNS
jgi:hypothetical protein